VTKNYFPPLRLLCNRLGITPDALKRSDAVAVPGDLLGKLLLEAISDLMVDRDAYLSQNQDVALQCARRFAEEHFKKVGYLEGRVMPLVVDESYYLKKNSDVADAIKRSKFKDARDHFVNVGVYEGRSPNFRAEAEVLDWNRFVASPRPSVDSCGRELKAVRPARRINDRFFTRAPELIRHLLGAFSNGIGSLYPTGRTRSWPKAAKTANLGRA
jgi:hypothetical protein